MLLARSGSGLGYGDICRCCHATTTKCCVTLNEWWIPRSILCRDLAGSFISVMVLILGLGRGQGFFLRLKLVIVVSSP